MRNVKFKQGKGYSIEQSFTYLIKKVKENYKNLNLEKVHIINNTKISDKDKKLWLKKEYE